MTEKNYENLTVEVDPNVKAWETRKGQAAAGAYRVQAAYPKITEVEEGKNKGEIKAQIVFTVVEAKDPAQIGAVCFENFRVGNPKIHGADKAKKHEGKMKAVLAALRPDLADKLLAATKIKPFDKGKYLDAKGNGHVIAIHYFPYEDEGDNAQVDYLNPTQYADCLSGKLVLKKRAATGERVDGDGKGSGSAAQRTKAKLDDALDEEPVTTGAAGSGAGVVSDDEEV